MFKDEQVQRATSPMRSIKIASDLREIVLGWLSRQQRMESRA
jgi:hypothetical protein